MARLLAEPLQNCQHCGDNPSTVKLPLAFASLGLQDLAEGGRMLSMQHLLAEHARQLGPYQICYPLYLSLQDSRC